MHEGAEVFSPELKFGEGCDIVIVDNQGGEMLLAEIKRCNLGYSDVQKAIRQLDRTEELLQDRYPTYMVKKVIVHDRRGRCKVFASISFVLEKSGIKFLSTASSRTAKRLRNLYNKLRKKK